MESKPSKGLLWTSYIVQGLLTVAFLMGGIVNMSGSEEAVKNATEMGYPLESIFYLGVIVFISAVLYAIPKTTFIGAILLTGWLGGAVATHIMHGDTMGMTMAPVIFGVLVWVAIGLRNAKLRQLL